jgi:hypothetical protein
VESERLVASFRPVAILYQLRKLGYRPATSRHELAMKVVFAVDLRAGCTVNDQGHVDRRVDGTAELPVFWRALLRVAEDDGAFGRCDPVEKLWWKRASNALG